MRKFRNETCTHERSVSKSYNGRALCTTRFLSIFSETEMKFSRNTDAARNVVDGLSLFISCNARATARKTETNSERLNVKASTMESLIVGRWSFGIGPIWCGHRCIYICVTMKDWLLFWTCKLMDGTRRLNFHTFPFDMNVFFWLIIPTFPWTLFHS